MFKKILEPHLPALIWKGIAKVFSIKNVVYPEI